MRTHAGSASLACLCDVSAPPRPGRFVRKSLQPHESSARAFFASWGGREGAGRTVQCSAVRSNQCARVVSPSHTYIHTPTPR
jgi:hypothetical protein